MVEQEGPFIEETGVDLEAWSRKVRNVSAAMRALQPEGSSAKQPKAKAKPRNSVSPFKKASSPSPS